MDELGLRTTAELTRYATANGITGEGPSSALLFERDSFGVLLAVILFLLLFPEDAFAGNTALRSPVRVPPNVG